MMNVANIVNFYPLNQNEKKLLIERHFPKKMMKRNTQNQSITKKEFIQKLKECFKPLYFDTYLGKQIAFMDDCSVQSKWKATAISEAKKYYAAELQDDEHIFFY